MSFNTSTSGGDNGNDRGGGESLYSKKLKRQKIPKRGPGVAELEKILRDQKRKDDHLGGGSSLISSSSKNAAPFSVDHDQFIIPPYGENVRSLSLGINNHLGEASGGAHARRSGIFLPQNTSSPAIWSSYEINSTDFIRTDSEGNNFANGFAFPTRTTDGSSSIIPSPVIPQKHMQYITAMINPFVHSGLASSLPPAVAGANYHHIEPPSNQISWCPYSNAWPEQEKMVHTKRHWPFSTNNLVDSPLLYQVSSYLPYKHQIEHSTSCGNERAFNLEPCVEFSREINSKSSLPTQRCLTEYTYRTPDGKIFMFGSPAIQITNEGSGQEVVKFESLPFQGTMGSCQRSMERQQSSESGHAGLVHKKPFYSFFELGEEMDRVDTSIRLKTQRVEERGDDVDLNLRL